MKPNMANIIEHKRVRFDFELMQQFEAGIELLGGEVKSLRNHHGKLEGAHVVVRGGEAYLVGMEIPPYQGGGQNKDTYDSHRNRRLLLNKKELVELKDAEETQGLTIVPIALYNKGRVIKISIAIAKGKKKSDKRETIKKREADREVARVVKNYR